MNKIFIFLLLFILPLAAVAQQEHHYTQFMYNKLLINPSYAGTRGVPTMTAMYRNQWYKLEGAPRSALISMHAPVFSKRVGVGGVLSHNSIGLHRDVQLSAAYSYNLIAAKEFSLRVGISGNLRVLSLDFTQAKPLNGNDLSLEDERYTHAYANFGAGIYGTFSERLYFGFSVPRIVRNTIGVNTDPNITTAKERPHFYGTTGGIIPLGKDLNFLPAVLIKYVHHAPIDVDVTANLEIKQLVTAGIAYRAGGDGWGESLDLLAYWQVNPRIGVGAAYDLTLSKLRSPAGGAFEVLFFADLVKRKKGMSNPRFFM